MLSKARPSQATPRHATTRQAKPSQAKPSQAKPPRGQAKDHSLPPAVHHVVGKPTPRGVCQGHHRGTQPRVGAGDDDAGREGSELRRQQEGVLVPNAVEPSRLHLGFSFFFAGGGIGSSSSFSGVFFYLSSRI